MKRLVTAIALIVALSCIAGVAAAEGNVIFPNSTGQSMPDLD